MEICNLKLRTSLTIFHHCVFTLLLKFPNPKKKEKKMDGQLLQSMMYFFFPEINSVFIKLSEVDSHNIIIWSCCSIGAPIWRFSLAFLLNILFTKCKLFTLLSSAFYFYNKYQIHKNSIMTTITLKEKMHLCLTMEESLYWHFLCNILCTCCKLSISTVICLLLSL